ncbi:MAG TPA: hypothetical protein VIJ18_05400 [Microbacteriaceae bacterium]
MTDHVTKTQDHNAIPIAEDSDRVCCPTDLMPLSRSRSEADDRSRGEADGRVRQALWGWSPPTRPTANTLAGRVERLLPRSGWSCLLYVIGVAALLMLAPLLPMRAQLAVDGVAFLAAGGWCALNFWLCRHAHCLVTGVGWSALAVLTFAEVGIGHSVIAGDEQLVFLGILVLALAFEATWYLAHGTNAVSRSTSRRAVR